MSTSIRLSKCHGFAALLLQRRQKHRSRFEDFAYNILLKAFTGYYKSLLDPAACQCYNLLTGR
jgi:hypothetical protein